jgi:DNA-binding transcriptional ArsR family regulator
METNYIYFGPKNTKGRLEQLRLPETTIKTVKYGALDLEVEYLIKFTGERLMVSSIKAHSDSGIATADLTKLEIPKILRDLVYEYNPELISVVASGDVDKNSLAQLYWAEYACFGKPRELFRRQLGIARNTANYHLKRLETVGLVPKDRNPSTKTLL